ncbi:leucine-rich repeat and calponin homology domain-containing protein [Anastrepha ludens]|uniref:leucine-rich repeat and calponin homology domain-containing protein n=1 Tax=Anastrepha ludens TaxID=28586 RepID=UPI0023AE6D59|nr:leucine-rich repeat and calponin homology domain-containing protein [Anastrepha ludens]
MAATAAVYNRLHSTSGSIGGLSASMGSMAHSQLARSLERILEEAHLSGELILTNRKLKDFPKTGTKYNLADTVMADLSRNRFCELPEEITTFSFLETLLLYHNTIRSIPESVKHLTSLTYLDLRSNQLAALPREICFLPLQVLLVSNNRLAALPDELGRMDRLTDLDASYNQLSTLPARIGELRSLRSFSLRSNQLMYLPRELTCLTLESLDVSNNRIASLPLEIRQMTALVELNLENNPLTSPPASLCIRGLVHVFKFLETQAAKDEKGSRAGGNYDGYTTLRRAPRHAANGSVLESNRVPRHHGFESGYSTCDGIDKRWSHDMPNVKSKLDSPARKTPTTPPPSLSSELMDASLTSSSSTIVDESISSTANGTSTGGVVAPTAAIAAAVVKPLNAAESPTKRKVEMQVTTVQSAPVTPQHQHQSPQQQQQQHQHINYAHSNSSNGSNNGSNGSSPEQEDGMMEHYQHRHDEKSNKNLGNIQTYREYKEALKQQRNLEVSSVYKIKNSQKMLYDMSEASNALNSIAGNMPHYEDSNGGGADIGCNEMIRIMNGANTVPQPKSIMKNGSGGGGGLVGVGVGVGVGATNGGLKMFNGLVNGVNGDGGGVLVGDAGDAGSDYCIVIPKKPVQKVTPSRNTELMSSLATSKQIQPVTTTLDETEKMLLLQQQQQLQQAQQSQSQQHQLVNGDCSGYVKPNSPMKTLNGNAGGGGGGSGAGILANNNKITSFGGLKSPVSGTNKLGTAKTHRTVTWNHDIPAEKLSFTMRREFDRQREETELMTQLRSIIETRLKMTLPEDIASALTDGVILCHLANYVRPRSVASIHVPSPGVSKLTMARCRRNVDNFLEACRRIGVDEELICSCADIVPPSDDGSNNSHSNSNNNKNSLNNNDSQQIQNIMQINEINENTQKLPNPSAVLKTVSALIALDYNPHHQNIRNLQQQYELKLKLQRQQEKFKQQQQQQKDESQQQHEQQKQPHTNFEYQRRCVLTRDGRGGDGAFEHEYEHQLTATCTKEQMLQPTLHTLGLDNSTFNLSAKCHFDVTVLTNGHGGGSDSGDGDGSGGCVGAKDFDSDDVDEGVGAEEEERDELDTAVHGDGSEQCHSKLKQHQQQQQRHIVTDFFRHAKLKTFQKIKFNLLAGNGGHSCINYGHVNNNQCMLQTIVETESEVIGGGGGGGGGGAGSGSGVGGGAYQLINEKPTFNEELKLKVESRAVDGGNKYKLIDLAALQKKEPGVAVEDSLPIVSKRIEFFEHSSAAKSTPLLSSSPNGSINSSASANNKIKCTTTTATTTATIKPNQNSIFSIYRVVEVNDEKLASSGGGKLVHAGVAGGAEAAAQGTGASFLLKHDSHVLTIILSCVFIITFLLLVFFPLPG